MRFLAVLINLGASLSNETALAGGALEAAQLVVHEDVLANELDVEEGAVAVVADPDAVVAVLGVHVRRQLSSADWRWLVNLFRRQSE